MPFLTQGKTNWKFILIVLILALLVGGGVLWREKTQEIPFTQLPEIKKPEKVIKDETVDWKTYRNEKYGYEVKYPQNLAVRENYKTDWNSIIYFENEDHLTTGAIKIKKGIQSIDQLIEEDKFIKAWKRYLTDVSVGKDEYKAKRIYYLLHAPIATLSSDKAEGVEYFIEHSGYVYQISFSKYGPEAIEGEFNILTEEIINGILSTFQFIELGEPTTWKTAKIEGNNKEYSYEIKYPQDWGYTKLEIPPYPTMFAPKDIIMEVKQSLQNIKNDKSWAIWVEVYDRILFERGILPYREKSTDYIKRTSSDIDVSGVKGKYYISEYIKDKSGYKVGDKTVTIDFAMNDIYFSFHLFDYQYLKTFNQMLSTFRFIE